VSGDFLCWTKGVFVERTYGRLVEEMDPRTSAVLLLLVTQQFVESKCVV